MKKRFTVLVARKEPHTTLHLMVKQFIKPGLKTLLGFLNFSAFNWQYVTYLLTYLLTHSMVQGIISKAESQSACQKKILLSYGTRRFITTFTKARHWTLYWTNRIQFAPSISISLRSIIMLSSHPRLGLPSGLLPSGLPTKTCKHLHWQYVTD
jgi:hypothetical protein